MTDRARKSSTRHATNISHQRIPLDDDYEVVRARTSSVRWGATLVDSPRDDLRGFTSWDFGSSWEPQDDPEFSLDRDSEEYDRALEAELGDVLDRLSATGKTKKNRSEASSRPRVFWKNHHRDDYLDELLRADGRGEYMGAAACPDCIARGVPLPLAPEFRCQDCFTPDLTCASCCVRRHSRLPFHRIEKWTGSSFTKTSLKDIGLQIHLNHSSMRCPLPTPVDARFRILHTNGIHDVDISYCGCGREIPRHLQLLRRGLYPATQNNVRTCVTFELLRLLHTLSLTAKVSTYDFYRGLETLTPGAAINRPKMRYRPLLRVLTQWRHLKMLKRAGRGHSPSRASGTSEGELALRCPSCPHPGINLPDDWENASPERKFLYALFLCMDANFRLRNNFVSNYSNDPGLGVGLSYMLPRGPYGEYVLSQADEKDISTCVGFQALAKATTRNTRGMRYSGVAMVVCGRSEMVLPNAVGNLQKGERYANIDYIFASALLATQMLIVCVSYDIVCQWLINLFVRMAGWPSDLRLRPGMHLRPLIPKFHYPAHKEDGHEQYSFNYADGVGLTDGEAIERVWSGHNALAGSTKVAGPGTRQDVLDDNFAYWNFLKYISIGKTLIKKYRSAVAERNKQVEAHRGFTASLPANQVAEWEEMCEKWSADAFPKTVASPYKTNEAEITEAEALKKIKEIEATSDLPPLHSTSPSDFLSMGLELEESQRRVKILALQLSKTPVDLDSSLKDQRAILKPKIQGYEQLRSVYIPGLVQILAERGENVSGTWETDPHPEEVPLWLPSAIPPERRRAACVEDLPRHEQALRTAQCSSSLHGLRQVLRLKTRMIYFKNKNIRGQREGTRSRSIIDRVHQRALRLVEKYRAARAALLKLQGPGDWEIQFQPLRNDDVRSYSSRKRKRDPVRRGVWEDGDGPSTTSTNPLDILKAFEESESEPEPELEFPQEEFVRLTDQQLLQLRRKGTGETRKEISWIWTAPQAEVTPEDSDHILRAEWAKSRARTNRAREEVELLLEEMRRVVAFLEHSSRTWGERIVHRASSVDATLMEGLQSYANEQVLFQQNLLSSFRALWKTPLAEIENRADPLEELGHGVDAAGDNDSELDETEVGDAEVDNDGQDDDEADETDDDEPSGENERLGQADAPGNHAGSIGTGSHNIVARSGENTSDYEPSGDELVNPSE